jgi:hypothetical protein
MKTEMDHRHHNVENERAVVLPVEGATQAVTSISSSVLTRLVSDWIPKCIPIVESNDSALLRSPEANMARFEFAVGIVLEQYLDELSVPEMVASYSAGLVGGFSLHAYARPTNRSQGRSAVAEEEQGKMCCESLREEMWAVGYLHGQLIESLSAGDLVRSVHARLVADATVQY